MDTKAEDFEIRTSLLPDLGMGAFTKVDITAGSFLHFKPKGTHLGRFLKREDIPDEFIHFCVARENGTYNCPPDFSNIEPIWYLNHSDTPNACIQEEDYYALVDIPANSEIFINYNNLDEPEDKKEDFYRDRLQ